MKAVRMNEVIFEEKPLITVLHMHSGKLLYLLILLKN